MAMGVGAWDNLVRDYRAFWNHHRPQVLLRLTALILALPAGPTPYVTQPRQEELLGVNGDVNFDGWGGILPLLSIVETFALAIYNNRFAILTDLND